MSSESQNSDWWEFSNCQSDASIFVPFGATTQRKGEPIVKEDVKLWQNKSCIMILTTFCRGYTLGHGKQCLKRDLTPRTCNLPSLQSMLDLYSLHDSHSSDTKCSHFLALSLPTTQRGVLAEKVIINFTINNSSWKAPIFSHISGSGFD